MKILPTPRGLSCWLACFFRTFRLFCLWPCKTSADQTAAPCDFVHPFRSDLFGERVRFLPGKRSVRPSCSLSAVCLPRAASSSPHLCLHFRVTFFSRSARLCNVRRRPLFPPSYHVSLSLFPSTPFDCSGVCTPNF